MSNIVEFKPVVIAGGVTDNPETKSNNPFPLEAKEDYVGEAMAKANTLDFEQVIIIGTTKDGFINYIHSDLGEERLVYLIEKFKYFILSGGMD